MRTIGITGSDGLIAWHLRCHFQTLQNYKIICANRSTFTDLVKLREFVATCDTIVHLAGANRGSDDEVVAANIKLAEELVAACEVAQVRPHIIFSNSTHIYRGTAYGASKRASAEYFSKWAERSGAVFTNLILPNVFGEHGRPFYNSVIATFCHQLTNDQQPEIKVDASFEYVHCHEISLLIESLLKDPVHGDLQMAGTPMSVTELLKKLQGFQERYRDDGVIPAVPTAFDAALFNTYRSYLYPKHYPVRVSRRTDQRGTLFETVKTDKGGQAFVSTTHPGITRGNHFHVYKTERFFVLSGEAIIRLRRMFSRDVLEFHVDGETPCYVDIPTLHTHNITNVGATPLVTLFWSGEIFDPAHSDTFAELV